MEKKINGVVTFWGNPYLYDRRGKKMPGKSQEIILIRRAKENDSTASGDLGKG